MQPRFLRLRTLIHSSVHTVHTHLPTRRPWFSAADRPNSFGQTDASSAPRSLARSLAKSPWSSSSMASDGSASSASYCWPTSVEVLVEGATATDALEAAVKKTTGLLLSEVSEGLGEMVEASTTATDEGGQQPRPSLMMKEAVRGGASDQLDVVSGRGSARAVPDGGSGGKGAASGTLAGSLSLSLSLASV